MKTALFVDFDNVYSGLRKLDYAVAERFARQPMRWVQWLLDGLELPEPAPEPGGRRRLLVRRVYLNPQVYQGFRAAFNHAGFEIIDCPAMTTQGKTSTDIHMVLDMVDLLQHEVHYDEFIVFSADADFTPVLRKLRRWDRRTTVLAVGFPSAAYRASADLLIDPDLFVREGMGFDEDPPAHLASGAMGVPGFHPAVADLPRVADATAGSESPLAEVPSEGPFSLGPAVAPGPAPAWQTGYAARTAAAAVPLQALAPDELAAVLAQRIRAEVDRSDLPVPCARIASRLMAEFPGLAPDWLGHLGFRRFAESLDLTPLVFDWSSSGGHLLDPERHSVRPLVFAPPSGDPGWGLDRATMALIRQVHEATGVPWLSPRDFKGLFEAICADVAEHPFQLSDTGKRVRDRCREAGFDVSREDVNWVLRGLLLCGHEFGQGNDDVRTLSYRLVGNLINLCRREQVVMDESGPPALHRWVSGKAAE